MLDCQFQSELSASNGHLRGIHWHHWPHFRKRSRSKNPTDYSPPSDFKLRTPQFTWRLKGRLNIEAIGCRSTTSLIENSKVRSQAVCLHPRMVCCAIGFPGTKQRSSSTQRHTRSSSGAHGRSERFLTDAMRWDQVGNQELDSWDWNLEQ